MPENDWQGPPGGGWRAFWTFTGFLSLFGTCAAAAAAWLGCIDPKLALAACCAATVLAFASSLQREHLITEASQAQFDQATATMRQGTAAVLTELRGGLSELKAGLPPPTAPESGKAGQGGVEARLSSLEGALLSTGRSVREVSASVTGLPDKLQASQRVQLEGLFAAVRGEVRRAVDARANEDSAGLAAVSSRLAAIDGSLAGLEVSQGELVRRLSISMNAALVDAESALQASVRTEIDRCMEPVRRLPAMVAAALPSVLPDAARPLNLPDPSYALPAAVDITPAAAEQLRSLMREEVQAALQAISQLIAQREAVYGGGVAASLPAPAPAELPTALQLDPEQWGALGQRLARLETAISTIAEAGQQPAALPGPSADEVADRVSAPLVASLAASQQQTVGAVQAGLAGLQDSMDRLAGLLEPVMASLEQERSAAQAWQGEVGDQLQSLSAGLVSVQHGLAGLRRVMEIQLAEAAGATAATTDRPASAGDAASEPGAAPAPVSLAFAAASEQLAALASQVEALRGSVSGVASQGETVTEALQELVGATAAQTARQAEAVDALIAQFARLQAATDAAAAAGRPRPPIPASRPTTPEPVATPAHEFAEGLMSREEDSGRESASAGPPAVAVPEGMLSREEEDALRTPSPGPGEAFATNGFSEGLLSRQEDTPRPLSPEPAATSAYGFSEGLLSRQEDTPRPLSPGPAAGSAYGFSEGMLSREEEAAEGQAAQAGQWEDGTQGRGAQSDGLRSSPAEGYYEQERSPPAQWPAGLPGGDGTNQAQPSSPEQYPYDGDQGQAQSTEQLPDLERLSQQDLVALGLQLLRAGREEAQASQDWGRADRLLRDAHATLQRALQLAPRDTRALGNCGNVLLAQGELKQSYLQALRAGPMPQTDEEREVQRAAEATLRGEALALLTRAGEMFKAVLELEGWSSRALVNWGRAMCIRAELTADRDLVQKLYRAALDKFEAVLEEEPGMVAARYRAALAMADLARTHPSASREAITLLMDACNYLNDLLADAATQPEAEALAASCAAALQQCQAELAQARRMRG